jgi:hypothetical protein
MEFYSAIKKNKICRKMDGNGDHHVEGDNPD